MHHTERCYFEDQLIHEIATTNSCMLCQLYTFITCGYIPYFSSVTSIIANSEAKYLPDIKHIYYDSKCIYCSLVLLYIVVVTEMWAAVVRCNL